MLTTQQMKDLEKEAEKKGTSRLVLMERAGKGASDILMNNFDKSQRFLFVCYHGNNGGDGFVCARYLIAFHYPVDILFVGEEEKLKNEARVNYKILIDVNPDHFVALNEVDFNAYDVIVDCIFGTGIKGAIQEPIASVIDRINRSGATKVCMDIPSGLDPDTGKILDRMVNPDLILTMHDIKPGLKAYEEKVAIVNLGL